MGGEKIIKPENRIVGIPQGEGCGNCYYYLTHKYNSPQFLGGVEKHETNFCARYPDHQYNTYWCGEWKKKL